MVSASPKAGTGMLCQLGDFPALGRHPQRDPTIGPYSGRRHRYAKLVDLTMSVMAEAVNIMLAHFGKVVIVNAEGNHDISGSIWLRKHLAHLFSKDRRVQVIDNDYPYYAYLHGQTMLAFITVTRSSWPQADKLFASEPRFREMWGQIYDHLHPHGPLPP